METTTLNNGVKMPQIGYGVFRMENDSVTIECVKEALRIGYRHIDTAAIYGNEEAVGQALQECSIPREQLFITTKCWNGEMRNDNVENAFYASLRRLKLDYVDLYLIHWPVAGKFNAAYQVFEKLYQAKKIRAIGVSNFHLHHFKELDQVKRIVPAVNQIELHPYLTQKEILAYCRQHGIVVESWSPLGAAQNDLLKNKTLISIGAKYNKTPAQIILCWNLELGLVPLPKSATPARIKENFEVFDFTLSQAEIDLIDGLNRNTRTGADPDNFNF
jgi:methylglyoxal/glyoxal reductase